MGKKPLINHDFNCFRCQKPKIKTLQVSQEFCTEVSTSRPVRSCTVKKPIPIEDPNALLECIACPRVYHFGCSNERQRPKTRAWYCPWHSCVTCKRKASDAGGILFHCVSCPLTYYFDCSPDEYTEEGQSTSPAALSLIERLERKGMTSLKSYMFFTCVD